MERSQTIVRASLVGIGMNLLLAAFKLGAGLLANSIAVVLDAVNNLSDALSSVITIVGTKLAGKRPDRKHPFGHGRIEYLSSLLIGVLVLLAGAGSLRESVRKLLHPEAAHYTLLTLLVIAAAVLAKILVGRYMQRVGRSVRSQALMASGTDALFDAVLSGSTLLAALASMLWGLQPEGWLGLIISGFILKAGVEILLEAVSSITGSRADETLSAPLRELLASYAGVRGVCDLALHNYGPSTVLGSVHIEVDDDMNAKQLHRLTRRMAADCFRRFGVRLTIGVYAVNSRDREATAMERQLTELLAVFPEVLQMHGFYLDRETKQVMFDLIADYGADEAALSARVHQQLRELWPDYQVDLVIDSAFDS